MTTNEQSKNDETRAGEDAGSPARGRVAQEQASGSVRVAAPVSMRTRARALYIAAFSEPPTSMHTGARSCTALGDRSRDVTISDEGSAIASSDRSVYGPTDREALAHWCFPCGTDIEVYFAKHSKAKARYLTAIKEDAP